MATFVPLNVSVHILVSVGELFAISPANVVGGI